MELWPSNRRGVSTPCRNYRRHQVHPPHQPQLGPRNGTHQIWSGDHSSHSNTYTEEVGGRMGGETQIVIHLERFPLWSHHEHARRAQQAVLFAVETYQHSIPQHHTNSNLGASRWCPLDVRSRKLLKAEFRTNWDSTVMHLTAFDMKLDKEQAHIDRLRVVISNKDKLQFYME